MENIIFLNVKSVKEKIINKLGGCIMKNYKEFINDKFGGIV